MVSKKSSSRRAAVLAMVAAGVVAGSLCGSARAALTLTAAGQAAGFTPVTTFASGFPTDTTTSGFFGGQPIGPAGIAFRNDGKVLVSDAPGDVFTLPNVDGQTVTPPSAVKYPVRDAFGLTTIGGTIYMTQQKVNVNDILAASPGQVVQVNQDGSFNQNIVSTGTTTVANPISNPLLPPTITISTAPTGIIGNPGNGHLLVGTFLGQKVLDVNPATKTASVALTLSERPDGLALAADHNTLYVAQQAPGGDHVVGYNLTTKAVVFDSGTIAGADGVAIGNKGITAGKLYVNTNGGQVVQVDLATRAQAVIASGGTRGDFLAVVPTDNCLLLTQTNSVMRLCAPAGSGFVGGTTGGGGSTPPPPSAVPEPMSLGLLSLALLGWGLRRKLGA